MANIINHPNGCTCASCSLGRENEQQELNNWHFQQEVDRDAEQMEELAEELQRAREEDEQDADCINCGKPQSWCTCDPNADEEEVPRTLVRLGRKEPRGPIIESDSDEIIEHHRAYQNNFRKRIACDEVYEVEPDLSEYFAPFKMDKTQVIAMCRTYANHLAQQVRFRSGAKKAKWSKK